MSSPAPARVAYFVMAHRDPPQLRWLIEAIAPTARLVLLHVDLKSMLGIKPNRRGLWTAARQLARRHPTVRLMRPRFTNWGGWSLSRILLDAIDAALDASPDWDYLVNLSGQDYPIQRPEALHEHLARADGRVLAEMLPFSALPATDWHLRWWGAVETPLKVFPRKQARPPPTDFTLDTKGSQWVMLPRAFCEWQRSTPVRARIERYLSRHFLSDELLIQSLVANGPWRDRIAPHHGRDISWPGHTVTMADWDRLSSSAGFFARKFDLTADAELTPRMAARLGLPRP